MLEMKLEDIQQEATHLPREERRKLVAFLTVLDMKETGEWQRVTDSINDGKPEKWIPLDEARRRLLGSN
jgi:hypothetical protein